MPATPGALNVDPLQTLGALDVPRARRHRRWGFLCVAALALVSHVGTLANGFIFDDQGAILHNRSVQGPFDLGQLLRTDNLGQPPSWRGVGWRPLPAITLWVDQRIGGGKPWAFHATNLLLHALASLVLTVAVARHSGRFRLGVITGALFSVFAVNTEAVAWIVGRADIMAAGLGFLAWANAPLAGARREAGRLATCGVLVTAALLCKETAITVPVWLVATTAVLHESPLRPRWRCTLWLAITLIAAVAIYLLLRHSLFAPVWAVKRSFLNNPLLPEPLDVRVWTGLRLLALIVQLILAPLRLLPDYSFAQILPERTLLDAAPLLGLLLAVALAGSCWFLRRREPMWSAGALILLVGWAALSNVVVALPIIFAERLLYGTVAAAALLVAVIVERCWDAKRRITAVALLATLVGGNVVRSTIRDRDWHDELQLFSTAARDSTQCARTWNNLGVSLMKESHNEDALLALARASTIAPEWAPPHMLTGITLAELGRSRDAEVQLQRAFELDRESGDSAYNLAVFLVQQRRYREAAAVLRSYLSANPDSSREEALLSTIELGGPNAPR